MDRFHCVANDTTMIPALLRAQGYRTHAIGEKQTRLDLTRKHMSSPSNTHWIRMLPVTQENGMWAMSRNTAHPRTEALRPS